MPNPSCVLRISMVRRLGVLLFALTTATCRVAPPPPSVAEPASASPREGSAEAVAATPPSRSVRTTGDESPEESVAPVLEQTSALRIPATQDAAGVPFVRFRIDVNQAPSRGPDNAPVTIVMFSDFECPFCQSGLEIVNTIEREYVGQIRFVYKAFPIDSHANAVRAALMAHSARAQDKFWPFHDRLFSQQGLSPDVLDRYAEAVGLDMPRVHRELDELTHAVALRRDLRQARRFGIRSTPTFFINGRHIRGAQSLDVFRSVVHQELALAEKWRREHGAQLDVYDHATRHGYVAVAKRGTRGGLNEDFIYPVPVGDSPQRGPATAKLTLVVFADFRCPYCARGHETIARLVARYGDELRVVYKHSLPPGRELAISAARASLAAAAQGEFWPFHDALYALEARFGEPDLSAVAQRVQLDLERFTRDHRSGTFDARIAADQSLAERLGVTGTPTYFVNGRPIEGAQPELAFRLLFAEELARADALLERGVAREQLYATLTSG
ncbi:MAG: hypothetical protein B7733_17310 [Myxococcales bacterium FL481]|nr:MAG: hypothetical protein B7733_17310 [Myxococcales bacterium FL481]